MRFPRQEYWSGLAFPSPRDPPNPGIEPRSPTLQVDSLPVESAYNTGDTGSIPGSGRCAREGIGYVLQYSCSSLVAQLVKNPPAMWDTWVRCLG